MLGQGRRVLGLRLACAIFEESVASHPVRRTISENASRRSEKADKGERSDQREEVSNGALRRFSSSFPSYIIIIHLGGPLQA